MCKILAPTNFEIMMFHIKMLFSTENAESYAHKIMFKKMYNSLGEHITNYIDDWSMLVVAVSVEEDETEVSYIEQAIQVFFVFGLEDNQTIVKLREFLENKIMDLIRGEVYIALPKIIYTEFNSDIVLTY